MACRAFTFNFCLTTVPNAGHLGMPLKNANSSIVDNTRFPSPPMASDLGALPSPLMAGGLGALPSSPMPGGLGTLPSPPLAGGHGTLP